MKGAVYVLFKAAFVTCRRKVLIYFIAILRLVKRGTGTVIVLDICDLDIILSRSRYQLLYIFFDRFKGIQIVIEAAFLCVYY